MKKIRYLFGGNGFFVYVCIEDSVANDYRFLARRRNDCSFLRLFIQKCDGFFFFEPYFSYRLPFFYSLS